MSVTPIADYALLSDCRSTAIVDRAGSVEWLCWPRLDGRSVFARMLDADAGHWSIAPVGAITVERRYVERTMVLETTFTTPTGTLVLTDALSTGPGERGHQLGHRRSGLLVRTWRSRRARSTCTWSSHRSPSTGSSHRWPGR